MVELMQLTSPPATSDRLAVCTRSFIRFANSGLKLSVILKSSSDRTPAREAVGTISAASKQTVSTPCRAEAKAKAKHLVLASSSLMHGLSFVSIKADASPSGERPFAIFSGLPNSDRSPASNAAVRTSSDAWRIEG